VQVGAVLPPRVRDTTSEARAETGAPPTSTFLIPARTLAASKATSGTLPVVNESRVDAVRRAVDDGRYHVDPQCRRQMLRFEGDLCSPPAPPTSNPGSFAEFGRGPCDTSGTCS
jgi:anti-sigma28 factor (negative regulator of flagellin synthesis)